MIEKVLPKGTQVSAIKMNEAGYVLYQQNRYKESLPYFKAAKEMDPTYEYANYNYTCVLALLYGQGEKIDINEIAEGLRRSLKLDPNKKAHMRNDTDLNAVRNLPEIQSILQ